MISKQEVWAALKESIEESGIQITFDEMNKIYKPLCKKLNATHDVSAHKLAVYQRALSLACLDGANLDILSYIEQAEKEITAEGK